MYSVHLRLMSISTAEWGTITQRGDVKPHSVLLLTCNSGLDFQTFAASLEANLNTGQKAMPMATENTNRLWQGWTISQSLTGQDNYQLYGKTLLPTGIKTHLSRCRKKSMTSAQAPDFKAWLDGLRHTLFLGWEMACKVNQEKLLISSWSG